MAMQQVSITDACNMTADARIVRAQASMQIQSLQLKVCAKVVWFTSKCKAVATWKVAWMNTAAKQILFCFNQIGCPKSCYQFLFVRMKISYICTAAISGVHASLFLAIPLPSQPGEAEAVTQGVG